MARALKMLTDQAAMYPYCLISAGLDVGFAVASSTVTQQSLRRGQHDLGIADLKSAQVICFPLEKSRYHPDAEIE